MLRLHHRGPTGRPLKRKATLVKTDAASRGSHQTKTLEELDLYCTDMTLVNYDRNVIRAEPLRCRSWRCDLCQPCRRNQLIALAASGEPTTFITLTSSVETYPDPVEAAKALARTWRIVRRAAMRRYGLKTLEFLAVFEATKRGRPHLHILARVKWIDQGWLSDQMAHHMGAPICDIRRIRSVKHAARYVAKYIGKQPHQFGTCKRYWRSQGYELDKEEKARRRAERQGWYEVEPCSILSFLTRYAAMGWRHTSDGDGFILIPPAEPRAPP